MVKIHAQVQKLQPVEWRLPQPFLIQITFRFVDVVMVSVSDRGSSREGSPRLVAAGYLCPD